ncbi:hypothetical protein [Nocardia farcinica]|uniref:hypothetical protein n=1 Tax=Nocardia farcinica TaxID=37329 RepID=UPI0024564970|nr:hypothetical protein [Nocardia farcinica]
MNDTAVHVQETARIVPVPWPWDPNEYVKRVAEYRQRPITAVLAAVVNIAQVAAKRTHTDSVRVGMLPGLVVCFLRCCIN